LAQREREQRVPRRHRYVFPPAQPVTHRAEQQKVYYGLKYLARYTHRVAISNGRLLSLHHGQVSSRWRDSKDHNHIKMMILTATDFIRRFLLYVLPSGFVKIRHFGFLALLL
jgi:hypothetical protein